MWTPGSSDWYVDGVQTASIQFQAPVDPATLLFNSWSDGGDWTGSSKLMVFFPPDFTSTDNIPPQSIYTLKPPI